MELRKGDAAEDIDSDFESWERDLLATLKAYYNACWNKQELLRFLRLHLGMRSTEQTHLFLRQWLVEYFRFRSRFPEEVLDRHHFGLILLGFLFVAARGTRIIRITATRRLLSLHRLRTHRSDTHVQSVSEAQRKLSSVSMLYGECTCEQVIHRLLCVLHRPVCDVTERLYSIHVKILLHVHWRNDFRHQGLHLFHSKGLDESIDVKSCRDLLLFLRFLHCFWLRI